MNKAKPLMIGVFMLYVIFISLLFFNTPGMLEGAPHKKERGWIALEPEKETKPYLLPSDHPDYSTIRDIFLEADGELTYEKMCDLGFMVLNTQGLHVNVAKHPKMNGYVFKFFKYQDFPGIDWQHWVKRVKGARIIQSAIDEMGFDKIFKAPKKWLVKTNSTQLIRGAKYPCYVLMAEDMRPKPLEKNHNHWRTKSSEETLVALHTIIKKYGFRDSARVNNVPYCYDGKVAFLDTEAYHTWPVNYHPLLEFLCSKHKKIWTRLVEEGGDKLAAY